METMGGGIVAVMESATAETGVTTGVAEVPVSGVGGSFNHRERITA